MHVQMEPEEIAEHLKVRFTRGSDDLGDFLEAGIRTASGRLLLFLRYTDIQAPGTTVLADAEDDLEAAREETHALLTSSK